MPDMPRGGRCSCAVITDSSAAVMASSTVVFSQPDRVEWLVLRASGIARRRTEEKRAEAFYPLRATTAADSPRDALAAHKKGLRASGIARRRTEEKRAEAFYPLRATTAAPRWVVGIRGDPRCQSPASIAATVLVSLVGLILAMEASER